MTILTINPEDKKNTRKANQAKLRELFRTSDYEGNSFYMRVEFVGPITHASAFKDMTKRGYIPVVNLGNGEVKLIAGDTAIVSATHAELIAKI